MPPLAAAPVAAPEPRPACAAPPDPTEAPPALPEDPSLKPALVPAPEEGLPLENVSGSALELRVDPAISLPLEEFVLPPIFNFVFVLFVLHGVIPFFISLLLFGGSGGSSFFFLSFIFPWCDSFYVLNKIYCLYCNLCHSWS